MCGKEAGGATKLKRKWKRIHQARGTVDLCLPQVGINLLAFFLRCAVKLALNSLCVV